MRGGRSALRVVLAVALVATIVANPLGLAAVERTDPVGEAKAQTGLVCTTQTILSYAVAGQTCDACHTNARDAEEDWLSIYTQADAEHASGESFRAVYENSITSSNETAFMRAEHATFEAWKNGSVKSEAKTAGREAIREFYAILEENYLNRWNTRVATMQNLHLRDQNVSDEQIRFSWSNVRRMTATTG